MPIYAPIDRLWLRQSCSFITCASDCSEDHFRLPPPLGSHQEPDPSHDPHGRLFPRRRPQDQGQEVRVMRTLRWVTCHCFRPKLIPTKVASCIPSHHTSRVDCRYSVLQSGHISVLCLWPVSVPDNGAKLLLLEGARAVCLSVCSAFQMCERVGSAFLSVCLSRETSRGPYLELPHLRLMLSFGRSERNTVISLDSAPGSGYFRVEERVHCKMFGSGQHSLETSQSGCALTYAYCTPGSRSRSRSVLERPRSGPSLSPTLSLHPPTHTSSP